MERIAFGCDVVWSYHTDQVVDSKFPSDSQNYTGNWIHLLAELLKTQNSGTEFDGKSSYDFIVANCAEMEP